MTIFKADALLTWHGPFSIIPVIVLDRRDVTFFINSELCVTSWAIPDTKPVPTVKDDPLCRGRGFDSSSIFDPFQRNHIPGPDGEDDPSKRSSTSDGPGKGWRNQLRLCTRCQLDWNIFTNPFSLAGFFCPFPVLIEIEKHIPVSAPYLRL